MSSTPEPRKILVITYYWPPSGGGGVQRWLKFVKYLPTFGWHPYVFTPENPSVEILDETLERDVPPEADVIRLPIWEPYQVLNKVLSLLGKKNTQRIDHMANAHQSLFSRWVNWIRGNLFVPDPRIFWVKPSVDFLDDFIRSNGISLIVTTGPPHSMHLIGLGLKKRNPALTWIADFRDPWSEWDLLDSLSIGGTIRKKHQRLEREVLTNADRVVTIAPFHVARFELLGGRKVDLITNGFDEDDFKGIVRKKTDKLTIQHIGMVDGLRDPRPFMVALKEVMMEDEYFSDHVRVEFIGAVNAPFKTFVSSDPVLSKVTSFRPTIPHAQLIKFYGVTDIQLLVLAHTVLAPGNLPGKFFEYLASKNFIFGIGPTEGDAAAILRETGAGVMIERGNLARMKETLHERFEAWKRGRLNAEGDVSLYTRRHLTSRLIDLIK